MCDSCGGGGGTTVALNNTGAKTANHSASSIPRGFFSLSFSFVSHDWSRVFFRFGATTATATTDWTSQNTRDKNRIRCARVTVFSFFTLLFCIRFTVYDTPTNNMGGR